MCATGGITVGMRNSGFNRIALFLWRDGSKTIVWRGKENMLTPYREGYPHKRQKEQTRKQAQPLREFAHIGMRQENEAPGERKKTTEESPERQKMT